MLRKLILKSKLWHVIAFAGTSSLVITFFSAALIHEIEKHHPESSIRTFLDSLYWAMGTFCRVGYGDIVPVTTVGKVISIVLSMAGLLSAALCTVWVVFKTAQRQQ